MRDVHPGVYPVFAYSEDPKPTVPPSERFADILDTAWYENFEDGSKSKTYENTVWFIEDYGIDGVEVIAQWISDESHFAHYHQEDIAHEVLNAVGEVDDPKSQPKRREILLSALQSRNGSRRYSAIIGLSNLCDISTITALEQALSIEQDRVLKGSYDGLIDYLKRHGKGDVS